MSWFYNTWHFFPLKIILCKYFRLGMHGNNLYLECLFQ